MLHVMTPTYAPFPWYGGKRRAAALVWRRFGGVRHYVEPFAGSLAVLLGRPGPPGIETINDLDCHIANFWRAVRAAPQDVAAHCDWPINEADLEARHAWLKEEGSKRVELLRQDPEYFDARVAGWWVWGISQWLGGGWCRWNGHRRPNLPTCSVGRGICSEHADPHAWMQRLATRLRRVRVLCGDWTRCVTPAVLGISGQGRRHTVGVFLDPPYSLDRRDPYLYREDTPGIAAEVRRWALEHADNPRLRIALCGLEGEHDMPASWICVPWHAKGASPKDNGRGSTNRKSERIWFSPHCETGDLFELLAQGEVLHAP